MIDLLQVFLLSMTPIGELRLSIPVGIAVYHLSAMSVFFVSVIGNLVPAILILFLLKKTSAYLSEKSKIFKKLFTWWQNNAKRKYPEKFQEYETIGLALFIAVPLPMTGAWTGALLATLMNLPLKRSLLALFLGVVGAGLIVTTLVVMGINIERYLGWQTLVVVLVFSGLIYYYLKRKKKL
jgi:uncharacterized membrane protein